MLGHDGRSPRADAVAADRRLLAAFSPTGIGLWLILLVAIAYSPLQIFVPIFLQGLHGLDPLSAGYMVAGASFGWTGMSASSSPARRCNAPDRLAGRRPGR